MATAKDVAQYLLKLDEQHGGEGISNLKLQKLAYYSQGFFGAIYDKPLFNERVEAWTYGPVIPELYHEYKCHGSNLLPSTGIPNETSLSKEEAIKRIESQMSPREKAALGDFVINNSYSKEDTFQQIDEILEKLKRGDKQND